MSLLHVIPDHVFLSDSQGSYKDVSARISQFESLAPNYLQIRVSSDDPSAVLQGMGSYKPRRIFIEYSYYPKLLKALRKSNPTALIAVRAHNIEPLQNIANRGVFRLRQLPKTLYGSFRYLAADICVRSNADIVYAINEWEIENYWRFLPGRAELQWLPYCTPESLIPERSCHTRDVVLCLPNSSVNRKSRDLVSRFCTFAEIGSELRPDLKFTITRDPIDWGLKNQKCVEVIGFQENLSDLMSRVVAVAVLSPRGYGFKTTIMDAIAAGSWALTHKKLYRRVSVPVRPSCVKVQKLDRKNIAATLEMTRLPTRGVALNKRLRIEAQEMLWTQFYRRNLANAEVEPQR